MSTKQIVVQKKMNAPLKKGPTPRTRGKNTNRRNRRRPMIENYQGGPLSRVQQFKLSKCAHDYLRALTDPFSNTIDAPCIPDLHDVPSWKIRTLQRGIFTVGTNGVGYLIVSPKSQSNNFASAVVSTALYAGTVVNTDTAVVGTVGVANQQYPFSNGDMTGGDLQARLVSCGVRFRYVGTELNRGGQAILLRLPTPYLNTNSVDGGTSTLLLSKQTAVPVPVLKRWQGLSYLPMNQLDYAYNGDSVNQSWGINSAGAGGTLAIMIDGSVPGNSFEYEIVRWHEIISMGDKAVANITPSATDVAGMSAIKNVLQNTIETPGESFFTRALAAVGSYSADDVSAFVTNVKRATTTVGIASKLLL